MEQVAGWHSTFETPKGGSVWPPGFAFFAKVSERNRQGPGQTSGRGSAWGGTQKQEKEWGSGVVASRKAWAVIVCLTRLVCVPESWRSLSLQGPFLVMLKDDVAQAVLGTVAPAGVKLKN